MVTCGHSHSWTSSLLTLVERKGQLLRLELFVTPWTIAHQAPLSMEFSGKQVAIPFSRGSSQFRDQTQFFCIAGRFFTIWVTRSFSLLTLTPLLYSSCYACFSSWSFPLLSKFLNCPGNTYVYYFLKHYIIDKIRALLMLVIYSCPQK